MAAAATHSAVLRRIFAALQTVAHAHACCDDDRAAHQLAGTGPKLAGVESPRTWETFGTSRRSWRATCFSNGSPNVCDARPSTDQVLEQCSGPTLEGRCPVSDKPPYVCAGLHLIGVGGPSGHEISLTVTKMEPGRCLLTFAKDRQDGP